MFDVGFGELVLISVIGLLVLGPQRLPKVAAEIGKWVGRARRTATQLRRQLEREIELSELETPPQRPAPPQPAKPAPPSAAAAAAPAAPSQQEPSPSAESPSAETRGHEGVAREAGSSEPVETPAKLES